MQGLVGSGFNAETFEAVRFKTFSGREEFEIRVLGPVRSTAMHDLFQPEPFDYLGLLTLCEG